MLKFSQWMHPGLKLKRWIFLFLAASLTLAVGLSGFMGHAFRGWRLDLISPHFVDRVAKQVQSLRFIDFLLLGCGIWGVVFAVRRLFFSLATVLAPGTREDELEGYVLKRARVNRGPKIVAIGGGTGLPALLSGLKKYTSNLTAVVTVADDGGSSGRLSQETGILPPGDLRNCLVALAEAQPLMQKLFQHRFGEGKGGEGGLSGHSFGNLFIAAMSEVTGDFGQAIEESSRVLAITGRVLPVTLERVRLEAELEDGRRVQGESSITKALGRVKQLHVEPKAARLNPEVAEAVAKADAIVMGPGSLFTSILPNLLVGDLARAVVRARALKIYACNVMTQPGETTGYSVADHLEALQAQCGFSLADYVIANSEAPSDKRLARYQAEGQAMVALDRTRVDALGVRLVRARLLDQRSELIRHDPDRLARAVMRLIMI